MKETFFSDSTEKDARTSARVLLRGTAGPLGATTLLLTGAAAGCAGAGAFFALSSSAHDLNAAGFGGDALGVSSASAPASSSPFLAGACWPTDFWVVEVALGGFAALMGMRGIAGIVAVRACFVTVADGWAAAG
jgi:hypothetical protein